MWINKKNRVFNTFFTLMALLLFFSIIETPYGFADSYVASEGRMTGTKITSLPYTITSPGYYYITKDLSNLSGTHGIVIEADNVTLDLMGFSLIGPGGSGSGDGIFMYSRTNVEIRNGTIRNFTRNAIMEFSQWRTGFGHRVMSVRALNNGYRGINMRGTGHIIKKCMAIANGNCGIFAGSGSTVQGNICYNNGGDGINVEMTAELTETGSTVAGNVCSDNTGYGISCTYGATITGNICLNNGISGIKAATGSTVIGNTCSNNDSSGIVAGSGVTLNGNTCSLNDTGIYAGIGSTVTRNTCRSNRNFGIQFGDNCLVDQNTITSYSAVNMDSCSTCTFVKNHAPINPD